MSNKTPFVARQENTVYGIQGVSYMYIYKDMTNSVSNPPDVVFYYEQNESATLRVKARFKRHETKVYQKETAGNS